MIYVGIDTGKHTGVAVWCSGRNNNFFSMIKTMPIHKAMKVVMDLKESYKDDLFVIFEDARQRKYFGSSGKEVWQGAGSIKRDAVIWEDFLTDEGIAFRAVPPAKGSTKKTPKAFKDLTGWAAPTSEHSRDAAMLVFGR
jgi:hypothetical protein